MTSAPLASSPRASRSISLVKMFSPGPHLGEQAGGGGPLAGILG